MPRQVISNKDRPCVTSAGTIWSWSGKGLSQRREEREQESM